MYNIKVVVDSSDEQSLVSEFTRLLRPIGASDQCVHGWTDHSQSYLYGNLIFGDIKVYVTCCFRYWVSVKIRTHVNLHGSGFGHKSFDIINDYHYT